MSELFNVTYTSEHQRPEPTYEQLKQQLELRIMAVEIHIAQLRDEFQSDPFDEWVSNDLALAESQLEQLKIIDMEYDLNEL